MENFKYLIPQELDLRWGLAVTTVGMAEVAPSQSYPSGNHPSDYLFNPEQGRVIHEYQIVYIAKGSGTFKSAHHPETKIQAGHALMLFPGEWHSYAPDPHTGWTEAWIGFTGPHAFDLVRQHFFERTNPIFDVGIIDDLWAIYARARLSAQQQAPAYQQQLAGYANLIISTVYSRSRQPSNMSNLTLNQINQAKQYMLEHITETIGMEEVAEAVGMGYSRFRKEFKTYTGFTPGNYFIHLKLAQSKELLLGQDLSCKEVAYKMGFNSVTYFHQLFYRFCGQTPNQFRKQVGK